MLVGKGGRKHTVVLLALGASFLLALLGKLSGDFATIVAVVVAAYNAAHMVQDWKRAP